VRPWAIVAEGGCDPDRLRQPQQRGGDGTLLSRMLLGIGREQARASIVTEAHRWYLVNYVRSLADNH